MMLRLRKLDETDAHALISRLPSERYVLSWGGPYFDFPLRVAAIKALIAEHSGPHPFRECWAVETEKSQLFGSFQLSFNYRNGEAVLGRVIIASERRGAKLGNLMLQFAEAQAFVRPQISRLELRVYTFNKPAVALFENAGFIHEGTARH